MLAAIFMISVADVRPWQDTLGKSDIQILRMGRESWSALFSEKYGHSNSANGNGLNAYASAVERVNKRILSDSKLPHRDDARRLTYLVVKFMNTALSLGETMDWNTGWISVGGGLEADVQEAVYGYLHPRGRPKPKPMVVSQVRKALDAQAKVVKDAETMFHDDPKKVKRIQSDYAKLYKLYDEIVPLIAATTGRTGSDRILGICLEAAEAISN